MDRYGGYGAITALYASPSPYRSEQIASPPVIYRQVWTGAETEGAVTMVQDAETLAQMLTPVYLPDDAPIAFQLFGGQSRQLRFSLEHLANLIHERSQLHRRHLADINHRHMKTQEQLFGARLHGKADGYRNAIRIEQSLSQLEEQKRRAEIQFWQDTVELRDKMFELASEYQALRHRTNLFRGLEPEGGADV